jgi:hypothetical protein
LCRCQRASRGVRLSSAAQQLLRGSGCVHRAHTPGDRQKEKAIDSQSAVGWYRSKMVTTEMPLEGNRKAQAAAHGFGARSVEAQRQTCDQGWWIQNLVEGKDAQEGCPWLKARECLCCCMRMVMLCKVHREGYVAPCTGCIVQE